MSNKKIMLYVVLSLCSLCFIAFVIFASYKIVDNVHTIDATTTVFTKNAAITAYTNARQVYDDKIVSAIDDEISNMNFDTSTESDSDIYYLFYQNTISAQTPEADRAVVVTYLPEHTTIDDNGSYVYVVQNEDTLCDISALFGKSVDVIANYNEIIDVNQIYSGSAICIPND